MCPQGRLGRHQGETPSRFCSKGPAFVFLASHCVIGMPLRQSITSSSSLGATCRSPLGLGAQNARESTNCMGAVMRCTGGRSHHRDPLRPARPQCGSQQQPGHDQSSAGCKPDVHVRQAVREAVGIPVLANGNILCREDAEACMAYTGAQGVLSAGGDYVLDGFALFLHCPPLKDVVT